MGQRDRERVVLPGPHQQYRPVELVQPLRGGQGIAPVHRLEEPAKICPDRRVAAPGPGPGDQDRRVGAMFEQRAEPEREPGGECPDRWAEYEREPTGDAGQPGQVSEQRREEAFEAVRRGEHHPRDPLRTSGHQHLGQRPTGVIGNQGDLGQVQPLQELTDQPGYPGRGEISVGHRDLVRPERPVRGQAPCAGRGERGHDLPPQVRIDQQAMDEHHDRPITAGVPITHPTLGEIDLVLCAQAL